MPHAFCQSSGPPEEAVLRVFAAAAHGVQIENAMLRFNRSPNQLAVPHPLLDRQARSGAEGTQLRLGQQGEPNRIRRFGERQQE
jgi:hypothetical protein